MAPIILDALIGIGGHVASDHIRQLRVPAVLVPLREEPSLFLLLLGLLIEVPRLCLGLETAEASFLPFMPQPDVPNSLARCIALAQQTSVFSSCTCHRSPSFLPLDLGLIQFLL